MGITEIVQSSGWKNFTAKLYGFGASAVIIGALFKIQHWPGNTIFLAAGLITEAVIFFFSAFAFSGMRQSAIQPYGIRHLMPMGSS